MPRPRVAAGARASSQFVIARHAPTLTSDPWARRLAWGHRGDPGGPGLRFIPGSVAGSTPAVASNPGGPPPRRKRWDRAPRRHGCGRSGHNLDTAAERPRRTRATERQHPLSARNRTATRPCHSPVQEEAGSPCLTGAPSVSLFNTGSCGLAEPSLVPPRATGVRAVTDRQLPRRASGPGGVRPFVATPVIPSDTSHHKLGVTSLDIIEELERGRLTQPRRQSAVAAYLDDPTPHYVLEPARRTGHTSEHALPIGNPAAHGRGGGRSSARVTGSEVVRVPRTSSTGSPHRLQRKGRRPLPRLDRAG